MTSLSSIKYVYLLGIGGIGMSALARYFNASGRKVAGYDKTPTPLTDELRIEGIDTNFTDSVDALPEFVSGAGINPEALVIYTPAIPKNNLQLNHLLDTGYHLYKRSEVLGLITHDHPTIAVAGTHGKTTTSTMIAHILRFNAIDCTAFLGGISKNYNTNLLLPSEHSEDTPVVVEADEYDRSFLTLYPRIAVITSLDADHLDIYGDPAEMVASYSEFASQVQEGGVLICKAGLQLQKGITPTVTYSINTAATYHATNIAVNNGSYTFSVSHHGRSYDGFTLTWPGRHNVENATGAIAACHSFGLEMEAIRKALEAFSGVKRRFDYQVRTNKIVYIDDYAHHPEELAATINSVKEMYPGKRVMGIFQPHLYSRTRDFADGFAIALSNLDELVLLDIYPAREQPIPGVNAAMIAEKVTIGNKKICSKKEAVAAAINTNADVILTLGAGDIDELVPEIRKSLDKKAS